MSDPDSTYLARTSERIVRMFERYVKNIDPDDEQFKSFISNYLGQRGVKDPHSLAYSELYKVIKDGIREYLKQNTPATKK